MGVPETSASSSISGHEHDGGDADSSSPATSIPPVTLARHVSHTVSLRRSPTVVPRTQRRGLLARLSLIPEVSNPFEYSRKIKWTITFIVALSGAAAPAGSAIVLPALNDIVTSLDTTATIANMSVAFYMLAMSIFPLWWSSFSETLGRRTIYLVSFALFILWGIFSAVANSISMLIVMRVLSGGASASVQAVGAGTIADIWEVKERGRAMGIFYLGPLCGPLLAPIIGGVLTEGLGWRSTQWFLVVYGAVVWLFVCFMLPETLRKKRDAGTVAEKDETADPITAGLSTSEEIEVAASGLEAPIPIHIHDKPPTPTPLALTPTRTAHSLSLLRRCLLDPLYIILYLRFPAVLVVVSYATIAFGSLYVLNISVQSSFADPPYNFSTLIVGLLYIPNSLGYVLASLLGGRWIDAIMKREARRKGRYDAQTGELVFRPEDRMRENAWTGALVFPVALVWYGWSVERGLFWLVPMAANFFFGFGSMLIFSMATTMLTEFMPKKASNGIALNNFVRNIFSCVGSVVAGPLIGAVGNGWTFTGLGVLALGWGVVSIWSMIRCGERWRRGMDGHPMFD
ncbi:MFS general substrate transporter [Saccharata proteae CBS 121410]|uniref:MFS general substrate transporter n=1 Tax=Saccharata proteae CBS 121410 TaxID=1314787 RepID=A0A9P4HWE3_9PEZI|nr:MFS general substrate transporter [Saccharata proteae CBS 121410]